MTQRHIIMDFWPLRSKSLRCGGQTSKNTRNSKLWWPQISISQDLVQLLIFSMEPWSSSSYWCWYQYKEDHCWAALDLVLIKVTFCSASTDLKIFLNSSCRESLVFICRHLFKPPKFWCTLTFCCVSGSKTRLSSFLSSLISMWRSKNRFSGFSLNQPT